ncbi:hypothetical protein [Sideroxydans sp. CL21]|nr:hypothetical protein [Sideroxydans sp. CL21]
MMVFVGLLVTMQFGWSYFRGTALERLVVDELTVKPAAWLIARITPEIAVRPIGSRISAPGGGINILNGCDGMDVVLLFVSAMLIAPIPGHRRLLGILAGGGLIYVCNQLRILGLFYSYRSDKSMFSLLHGMIAPIVLILIATAFFAFWLGMHNRDQKIQIK